MKITKLFLASIVLVISIVLFGCANTKPEPNYMIELCDYKNLSIDEDIYNVTTEDLQASMSLYANAIDDKYKDYTYLTDSIVKRNYDCETVSDFRNYVLREIITHRISDDVLNTVLTTSRISLKDESEFNEYYNRRLAIIELEAKEEDKPLDSFIEEFYGMSKNELRENEYTYFLTIVILKEILDLENSSISQDEINDERNVIAQELECSVEETYKSVLDEDIIYTLAENRMYELIAQWYQLSIETAISSVSEKVNAS